MVKTIKFIFIFILIFICLGFWFALKPSKNQSELNTLLTPHGEVTDGVVRLLGWTGIRIKNDPLPIDPRWPEAKLVITSRDLEDVAFAINGEQDPTISWRQKPKKEALVSPPDRWEMTSNFTPEQIKNIVDIYFIELRLGEDPLPKKYAYDGVLFLGGALPRVRLRLAYLNKLIEDHDLKAPFYLLTGERTLSDAAEETILDLLNLGEFPVINIHKEWVAPELRPQNEYEMVKMVFDQSKHPSLSDKDLIRINAEKREGETRATREGTVAKWLEMAKPKSGTYLVIANQPYNLNQMLVVKRVLLEEGRPDIKLIMGGPRVSEKEVNDFRHPDKVAVLLDNLNRIFHELKKIKAFEKRYGKSLQQLVRE